MQDPPKAQVLISIVAQFLRDQVAPITSGRLAYDLRIAINALDLAARESTHARRVNNEELRRLVHLIGLSGNLEMLNAELCARLRDGRYSLEMPAVSDHLWRTTLDKLAIDQPTYAAYCAEIGATSN
jgi:hypothetical protein